MESNVLSTGIECYNRGDFSGALSSLLAVSVENEQDGLELSYYLGLTYAKLFHYEDALLYLEQVVTSDKNTERVLQCRFILAIIYAISGRKKLASYELNKLIESDYKTASVYASLAFVSWEQSDTEKCLEYYEKSLEVDPENITALNGMGYVLANEDKDLTKALSFCKKAVDSSPDSAACLDSLGWVYYKLGLYGDAKKYLDKAKSFNQNNPEIESHIRALQSVGEN